MESFQQIKNNKVDLVSSNDPLDKNRLLIEDLWESVLREECPEDQAERLIQLKELSYSKHIDGDGSKTFKNEIVDIVNSMDLACLLYTSPSPRDLMRSRMPSSA